jgi:hypothetical protein
MKTWNLILVGLIISYNLNCQTLNLWPIQKSDGKSGFIDSLGTEVFKDYFDYYGDEFKDGLVFFQKGSQSGFLNEKGNVVFTIKLDYSQFSEGLLNVNETNNFYYLNTKGEIALDLNNIELPIGKELSEINQFSSGLALIRLQNIGHKNPDYGASDFTFRGNIFPGDWVYGFINKAGNWIVPPTLDEPSTFIEGLAKIVKNGKLYFIDTTGAILSTISYSNVNDISEGFGIVYSENNMCFFINKFGKKLGNNEYRRAHPFREGLAAVEVDDKWGFIDTTGKMIIEPKYYQVNNFSEGLASVSIKVEESGYSLGCYFIEGFIDKSGNIIIPFEKHVDYHFKGFIKGLTSGRRFIHTEDKQYTGYYELFYMDKKGKKIWSETLKQ